MDLDVLSDVLRAVRLTGAVYFELQGRAPWAAETPPVSTICSDVMPDFEHVIAFHIVLDGTCWAALCDDSDSAVRMTAGDAIIFVGGDAHVMSAVRGQRATPNLSVYRGVRQRPLPFVFNEFGGSGAPTHLACGYLGCDARPFNPVLEALPRMLLVHGNETGINLTYDLIRAALRESERPRAGGETILSKLSELMFLQAIRQHIDSIPAEATGWLSGLRDRHVGKALSLMHGRPSDRWTIDGLAREVGLSRSAFAERFSHLMGVPPMQYLGNWRLQLAAQLLERNGTSIAQAARDVGYESEAAFNRAFKKQVGIPPGSWRRSRSMRVAT
ncbi:MAG: AraC family transcriptional regulator [Pseudolabrys sp.]